MMRALYEQDHEAFRSTVKDFIARYITPRHEKIIEQKFIDREIWLRAGELGFLGLGVPEEFGGSDAGDYRFSAVLSEELSAVSVAFSSSLGIHYDVVAPYLVDLTTDEQKARWLPRFCTGEMITAIGMTEPAAGSDLAGIRSTARRDGDDWVLNGGKTFITNGFDCDLVIVAAKTSPDKGAKGITLFAVEKGMPGFEKGRKLDKVGQPEADTAELFFTDVRVPASNVIGEIDRGFIHMMRMLPQERIGSAINNLANARALFAETLDYVKQRKAFGQPVGSFQYNKFVMAELVTQLEVTQAYVDQSVAAHADGALSAVDAAKAKWWTADVQSKVLDACLQLHGGYGFMNEYRIARAWKDARVTRIWAGSNEIMKEIIGRDLGL